MKLVTSFPTEFCHVTLEFHATPETSRIVAQAEGIRDAIQRLIPSADRWKDLQYYADMYLTNDGHNDYNDICKEILEKKFEKPFLMSDAELQFHKSVIPF